MNSKNTQENRKRASANMLLAAVPSDALTMFIDRNALLDDLSNLTSEDLHRLSSLLSPSGDLLAYQRGILTSNDLFSAYDIYLVRIFGTLLYRNFKKEVLSTFTLYFGAYQPSLPLKSDQLDR